MTPDPLAANTRTIVRALCIFIIQVAIYMGIYSWTLSFYPDRISGHTDVSWGIAVRVIMWWFVILVFFYKIFLFVVPQRLSWLVLLIVTFLYLLLIPVLNTRHPYRGLHLLITGVIAIWLPYLCSQVVERKKNK